jgi:hypothetical protein
LIEQAEWKHDANEAVGSKVMVLGIITQVGELQAYCTKIEHYNDKLLREV